MTGLGTGRSSETCLQGRDKGVSLPAPRRAAVNLFPGGTRLPDAGNRACTVPCARQGEGE